MYLRREGFASGGHPGFSRFALPTVVAATPPPTYTTIAMSKSRLVATVLFLAALALVLYRVREQTSVMPSPAAANAVTTVPATREAAAQVMKEVRPAMPNPQPVIAAAQPPRARAAVNLPPVDPVDPVERNARERERTIGRYAALYRQLGLLPEKADRLTQLLMDDREAGVDFAAASARYGKDVGQDRAAFAGSVSELRAQIQGEIRALLGEEGYAAFQAADVEIRQAAIVERLQTRLTPIKAGLNDMQAAQMLAVLREAGVHNLNDEVLARAATFLSAPQLEILTEIKDRQRQGPKKEKIQQAVRENLAPGGAAAPGR
jgi:hypothetical protein